MMKLSVLLLLALPALSSAHLCICENTTESDRSWDQSLRGSVPKITGNWSTDQIPPILAAAGANAGGSKVADTSLEWVTWTGSVPNGAISIYNGYVGSTDYVCKLGPEYECSAGFYRPSIDPPQCFFPNTYTDRVYHTTTFQLLVNKNNFEFMQWKEDSYGSVPHNSIRTTVDPCPRGDLYIAKNEYGLGVADVRHKSFALPWEGKAHWYNTYQVLTFSKDANSEHISDVKYKLDGINILKYPPEIMTTSAITNYECKEVTGTATLSKTVQKEQRWDTSFSLTTGVTTTISAGIPKIGEASITVGVETTLQLSKGTTHIESSTYSVAVQHKVPPNHSCSVSMVGYKYGADIPYTARLSRTYRSGETTWTSISGTYKGVQVGEVRSVVDRCVPVADPSVCS